MIPARIAPYVTALLLSGIMSCLVTFIATLSALGFFEGFLGTWFVIWLKAWAIACPTMIVFGPVVRGLVARNTRPD